MAHQFAFFIDQGFLHNTITIDDPILYHRIVRVLKCTIGSCVQLFNIQQNACATLLRITKTSCIFELSFVINNEPLKPSITLGLPLLKGGDLDEAISLATQVGVSAIQLLLMDYAQRSFVFNAEHKRLMRVVVAATEQSKRFSMPIIKAPISFRLINECYPKDILLFGSQQGITLQKILSQSCLVTKDLFFVVGPEADFSPNERVLLEQWEAKGLSLGPTVLRSCTAVGLGVGLLRALTT